MFGSFSSILVLDRLEALSYFLCGSQFGIEDEKNTHR